MGIVGGYLDLEVSVIEELIVDSEEVFKNRSFKLKPRFQLFLSSRKTCVKRPSHDKISWQTQVGVC